MAKDTQIPVGEFMQIRDTVAGELRKGTTGNTQAQTLVRQAERLLLTGYIDVDAVRADLAPKPSSQAEGHPDTDDEKD